MTGGAGGALVTGSPSLLSCDKQANWANAREPAAYLHKDQALPLWVGGGF